MPGEDVAQCVAVKQHVLIGGKKKKRGGVELRQGTEEEETFSHELLGLKMQAHSYWEANKIK